MARYFLDTNLLVHLADANDPLYAVASAVTLKLLNDGHELAINGQVLIELWAVATRPPIANGLGWEIARAEQAIQYLRGHFIFLEDNSQIFENWLRLVTAFNVRGKQVHDTRLVAAMLSHGITELLTFNDADFKRFTSIRALNPADVAKTP